MEIIIYKHAYALKCLLKDKLHNVVIHQTQGTCMRNPMPYALQRCIQLRSPVASQNQL